MNDWQVFGKVLEPNDSGEEEYDLICNVGIWMKMWDVCLLEIPKEPTYMNLDRGEGDEGKWVPLVLLGKNSTQRGPRKRCKSAMMAKEWIENVHRSQASARRVALEVEGPGEVEIGEPRDVVGHSIDELKAMEHVGLYRLPVQPVNPSPLVKDVPVGAGAKQRPEVSISKAPKKAKSRTLGSRGGD